MSGQPSTEDQEILEKFNRGELRRAAGAEDEMETARQAARSTFNKTRRVNLRVTERDFNLAHARAREEGIPYRQADGEDLGERRGQALERAVLYTV